MLMDTEIKNAVRAADDKARYDERAKRLVGHKHVLAYILTNTVDEFKGMNPRDVIPYIEGEPMIGTVPVEPGMTNRPEDSSGESKESEESGEQGQRVVGLNSENQEINEGLIRFDIIFYVRMKDGLSQIIINVEIQRDKPSGYDILNRAIFYVSRMVSSQKERDFVHSNFDDIRRVYSIWVCAGMSENSLCHVQLTKNVLLGTDQWEGKLDLLNIVLIGLSDELPEHDKKYELHRLLGALLSKKLSVDEKLNIIEKEYNIPVESSVRRDIDTMCNLSEGLVEDGIAIGEAKVVINMHRKGYALEQIAEVVEKSIDEVEAIIAKGEPVFA